MNFTQVKGKTWVLEGLEWFPVYRLDETHCILLDTGFPKEQKKLEAGLAEHGLVPRAVACSHAHVDHVGSAMYFHTKYEIPLYISQEEAGILCSYLNLKAYRPTLTPKELRDGIDMLCTTATVISDGCEKVVICGAEFGLHKSRGHSSGHLSFVSPDGVCYLGDSLLKGAELEGKLPFAVDIGVHLANFEEIRRYPYGWYILAHGGVVPQHELGDLVDANRDLFLGRASVIKELLGAGKNVDQLTLAFCEYFRLNARKPKRILMFQRTIRFFLEYLEDNEEIEVFMDGEFGVCYRGKKGKQNH